MHFKRCPLKGSSKRNCWNNSAPPFDIFMSSMNEKQNWIVRNKRKLPLREDLGSRKGITSPLGNQCSLHKAQNPPHIFLSLCYSQTQPRHSVKPWKGFLKSRGGSPGAAWKRQSGLCHSSYIRRWSSLQAGQGSHFQLHSQPWQDQATGQKNQETSAHTALSSRGWRDAVPGLPVPGISPILYCRLLLTVFSTISNSSGPCVPHMHLHHLSGMASFTGPQQWTTEKSIFNRPFYTEGIRVIPSLSHAEEVGGKEEALILLVPICKWKLRNSAPSAARQSTEECDGALQQFTVTIKAAVTAHCKLKRAAAPCFTARPSHLPQPAEIPLEEAQPVMLGWNTISLGWPQAPQRAALQNLFHKKK